MILFPNLTPAQVTLLHDILHREMLDARRGRYSRAEGTVLEEMYAEVFERAEEARSASTGMGDATNREVVGAVSQGPNTSPSTQQPDDWYQKQMDRVKQQVAQRPQWHKDAMRPSGPPPDDCRAEFERWATKQGHELVRDDEFSDLYAHPDLQCQWEGWQSAWMTPRPMRESGWRDAAVEKPPLCLDVLVAQSDKEKPFVAFLNEHGIWDTGFHTCRNITHWMNLPEKLRCP